MRIGIIGTGDISHSFMKAIQELQDLRVSAVYQRNIEKAHHFAKTYQIDYASDDFEMFSGHVDLVYNALPNALHYEFALKSIKEGKHVIVEKPITINLRQYEELIKQAKEHKVKVFEMNRVLALPHMKQLESYMEKENGKTLVHLDFCKKSRRYEDYKQGLKPNVFTTEFAGGALYDLGVYALHFMVKLSPKCAL